MITNKPVVCLMGPTAVGKTSLAIELYHKLSRDMPLDLISVDSAMIYKGLNIGTGKPAEDILQQVPHGLVDINLPHEIYSVANFYTDVIELINCSHSNNRVPLLVGGTMMYLKALQTGLAKLPGSDPIIRQCLAKKLAEQGLDSLYQELLVIDPIAATKIDSHDSQRILRALEVYFISGQNMTSQLELFKNKNKQSDYYFINMVISPNERSYIHDNIKTRFFEMLELGFIDEVSQLYNNPKAHIDLPAMRACGYRQIWQYLIGNYTKEEMIERSIISTRQLAKRQLTWLRSWHNVKWYDTQKNDYQAAIINDLLSFDLYKCVV